MRPGPANKRFAIALITAAFALTAVGLAFATQGVADEYGEQKKKLADDDIAGHYSLALWCKEKEAWSFLRDECSHILRLEPEHEQARLLLALAKKKLASSGQPGDQDAPGDQPPDQAPPGSPSRLLTDEEIQIIRRAELLCGQPERITVQFKNDVLERFFSAMESRGLYLGREDRARFFKLAPAAKAQTILCADPDIREQFVNDIVITNDPQRLLVFERHVMPIIAKGCATTQCHGGPDARGFRMFVGRNLTKNKVYTNFLLLQAYGKNDRKLINRDYPDQSLLLTYAVKDPPAALAHPTAIDPVFRTRRDRRYQNIQRWLQSLEVRQPEYGIDLEPKP